MGRNLASLLTQSVNRVALKRGYAVTYADLDALSDRFAGRRPPALS